tara:strand:+ start:168 stop:371 length:204 start_codon:yes stop_codon:yes gene_type:complete
MKIHRNSLKSIINLVVVFGFALAGFIKVNHPLSYLVGVPVCSWVVYLLSNAMCTDLLFGEKYGTKDE